MTIALETVGLNKHFGGLAVTRDLSLRVAAGARHALIGPNGAGKTTVINLLTGVLKPNGGRILLEGSDITALPVHTRVLRGLSRTFQINQLYPDLTPLETVGLAVSERLGHGGDWWRRMGTRADVNDEIAENLATYTQELLKFNKTVNLISATTIRTVETTHFYDAIAASRLIQPAMIPGAPLYDFGSGNGLPGLVFAILNPKTKVVLVDRDQRKLEFCKHVAATVKLTNLTIHVGAVEDLPESSVKNAVGRGFAPLSRALLTARKVVGKDGKFFHLKGDGWANELAQVPSQLFTFWSVSLLGQYRIPDSTGELAVVVTVKVAD